MTILYISDITLKGSGYTPIGIELCRSLQGWRDQEVFVFSLGYDGKEHWHPFRIIPTSLEWLPKQVRPLMGIDRLDVQAIVIALDIPLIAHILDEIDFGTLPVVGIFPVEAGPLMQTWTMELWQLYERFVMSEYGVALCEDVGLTAQYMPIPPVLADDPSPLTEEAVRDAHGIGEDEYVVLTIADNQERKNLSAAMEGFKLFSEEYEDARWVLVTRMKSPIGWNLRDLARHFGLQRKITFIERGLPLEHITLLYRLSDVVLLTSKAEGLGLPVREAMYEGTPVVATDCTGIAEQLADGRGVAIPYSYRYIDVFGNANRYLVKPEIVADHLIQLREMPSDQRDAMIQNAKDYARSFEWERSSEKLKEVLADVVSSPRGSSTLLSPSMVR